MPTVPRRLPPDYRGAVFVSDVDDTLRDSACWRTGTVATAPAIPGARRLLRAVSRRGVPILYLTAAHRRARAWNLAFLGRLFPPGVLVDYDSRRWGPVRDAFKASVLRGLAQSYPRASLLCLGDDAALDPWVYRVCASRHIRHAGRGRCSSEAHRDPVEGPRIADRYPDIHRAVLRDLEALHPPE